MTSLGSEGLEPPLSDSITAETSTSTSSSAAAKTTEIITDVSCERCRKRRVKCNRTFPRCSNCFTRGDKCNLADWTPLDQQGGGGGNKRFKGRGGVGGGGKRRKAIHHLTSSVTPEPVLNPTNSKRSTRQSQSQTKLSPPSLSDSLSALQQRRQSPLDSLTSPIISTSSTTFFDPSASGSTSTFFSPQTQTQFPPLATSPTTSLSLPLSISPPISFLPFKDVLQRRQPRLTLCQVFIQGESALNGLGLESSSSSSSSSGSVFDLPLLRSQLESICPSESSSSSSESSCLFFPSPSSSSSSSKSTLNDTFTSFDNLNSTKEPTPSEANEALSVYFSRIEPTLHLFPTNQSRQFLYDGVKTHWRTPSVSGGGTQGGGDGKGEGGMEWKGLYLATVASCAIVSNDVGFISNAREWMKGAIEIVMRELRFASQPTLNSLRTLLLVLQTSLLGVQKHLDLNDLLAFLPIFVSAAFKLELNFDPIDLGFTETEEVEERRGLWWHVVRLELIWTLLLETSSPTIDLSTSTTRLPLYLDSTPELTSPTPSVASVSQVFLLNSRLLKLLHSSQPRPLHELQSFAREILECAKGLEEEEGAGEGAGKELEKAILWFGLLRLESFGEETIGMNVLSDEEWSSTVWNLLNLVSRVPNSAMSSRLPLLLLIFHSSSLTSLRLSRLPLSQLPLRLSLSSQLSTLTQTLRTTPWPSYLHRYIKRGVVVIEFLTKRVNESVWEFVGGTMGIPVPDPSLSFEEPGEEEAGEGGGEEC
ncbi:Zn(II)2Cys6 transcription factor domain-containing protein [Sporobolomyces salmoneus]|uniref:Zn(II)2Cys6 transcription factor domain-containing protein n=1 Tax=Sporobolomyces salmoneus TaxID=183962 RepID=UPI00316B44F1